MIDSADVVVVGGGIVGCSVAYHLAKHTSRSVVLLEQNALGGGTTWHAAGMVGRLRTSSAAVQMSDYSARLYASLEEETGVSTGFKQVGSVIVARCEDRMTQLRRTAGMASYFGVEVHEIGPDEAKHRWPLIQTEDLLGGIWIPHDGKVVPADTARALAAGARLHGATIVEGARVLDIEHQHRRATGVRTAEGVIRAEAVVLAGGMWSRQLGLRCGVNIPLHPVEHHYVVTEPIEGAFDELPCGRDPDGLIYFRGEGDAIVLGAFQEYTKPWQVDEVPADFSFQLLEDDWDKYVGPLEQGRLRIPALRTCKFARFVNGPESFTPDNRFMLGESPDMRQLYLACGFNSVGIATGGGAGKMLAEWIDAGEAPMDLWAVDPRRFAPFQNNRAFLLDRVTEMLGLHYQMAWPTREPTTGRDLRRSPLHDRLAERGACFGARMGLERPLWFAADGEAPVPSYSFERPGWFEAQRREHMAAREAVAVFDQTSFSKFALSGPDAVQVLQRLCGGDVDVPVDATVYTGMFNERGTFESDLTAIRTRKDRYDIITATGQRVRDFDWIQRNIRPDENAGLIDISTSRSVIGVMGPRSRDLLGRLTDADLSLTGFPFGTSRVIDVSTARVRAVRITYVGELGWELHVSTDQAVSLFDRLMAAGDDLGVTCAGHHAINSLRLEKAYRSWGHELSIDDNPIEAGLSFAIDWDTEFIGKAALQAIRAAGARKRMVSFVLQDPEPMLWGGERIYRDGACVGYTTSGSYGFALGGGVALGYVRSDEKVTADFIRGGEFAIDVAGRRVPAKAHLSAPYDRKRAKILV